MNQPMEAGDFSALIHNAAGLHRAGALDAASAAYDSLARSFPQRAEPVRLQALLKMEAGVPSDALVLAEHAVAREPLSAHAWETFARISFVAGRPVLAEAAAVLALARAPHSVDALLTLASVLLARGDKVGALRHLRTAHEVRPEMPETSFRLAEALRELNLTHEAIGYYKKCLSLQNAGGHFGFADAHNNCGLVLLLTGDAPAAREHFDAAIRIRKNFAEAYYNRGISWRTQNRLAEAVEDYRTALSIRSAYPEALNNLGSAMLALKNGVEAEAAFRAAIQAAPQMAMLYTNLLSVLLHEKKTAEAERVLQEGLRRVADPAELDYCHAWVMLALDRHSQAEPLLDRLLARDPMHVGAREIKASVLMHRRAFQEAIGILEPILEVPPGVASRWSNLGTLYIETQNEEKAIECFQRAIAIDPSLSVTSNNLALALKSRGRLDEAEAVLRAALDRNAHPGVLGNLAHILLVQGRRDAAREMLEPICAQNTAVPGLHCNLGVIYLDDAQVNRAMACFGRALEIDPGFSVAKWNLAFCYLLCGDYERGWPYYEMRLSPDVPLAKLPKLPPSKRWEGEPLAGRSLLVVAEQGFGDQIQCLRFLPRLKEMGARVTVLVHPALLDLAKTVTKDVHVASAIHGRDGHHFDFHVFMMSLPGLLGVRPGTALENAPYVQAGEAQTLEWDAYLNSFGRGTRIGLVWAGNPAHPNDRYRSIPVDELKPLLETSGVTWIAVDKAVETTQMVGNIPVHAAGRNCDTFAHTAALINSLDLVISADTAVAHLAGALGKPCWVLLPANPDWRWLREREDSPWYPSVRLFRQQKLGEWGDVIDDLRFALAKRVGTEDDRTDLQEAA